MTARIGPIVLFLLGAVVLAQTPGASAGEARAYSCDVPRALLCEGCASEIMISLLADGRCRVGFTSSAAPVTAPAVGEERFSFRVDVAPPYVVSRRPTSGYWRAGLTVHRRPLAALTSPRARCFVFNGNSYCE